MGKKRNSCLIENIKRVMKFHEIVMFFRGMFSGKNVLGLNLEPEAAQRVYHSEHERRLAVEKAHLTAPSDSLTPQCQNSFTST